MSASRRFGSCLLVAFGGVAIVIGCNTGDAAAPDGTSSSGSSSSSTGSIDTTDGGEGGKIVFDSAPFDGPRSETSDFSKHVDALGEMLELTGDHGYATIRVLQYQQAQRGEAVPPSALRGPTAAPPSGQVTTGQTSGASPDAIVTRSDDHAAARRGAPPAREQL